MWPLVAVSDRYPARVVICLARPLRRKWLRSRVFGGIADGRQWEGASSGFLMKLRVSVKRVPCPGATPVHRILRPGRVCGLVVPWAAVTSQTRLLPSLERL